MFSPLGKPQKQFIFYERSIKALTTLELDGRGTFFHNFNKKLSFSLMTGPLPPSP